MFRLRILTKTEGVRYILDFDKLENARGLRDLIISKQKETAFEFMHFPHNDMEYSIYLEDVIGFELNTSPI